jgi:hypothetical protein
MLDLGESIAQAAVREVAEGTIAGGGGTPSLASAFGSFRSSKK